VNTLLLLLSLLSAVPVDNTNDRQSWAAYKEIGYLTGCNGAVLNTTTTCGDLRITGYNALTLEIRYDRAAGSGYEFYLESCSEGYGASDCGDATDWHRVAIEHPSPAGVMLINEPFYRDISSDEQLVFTIGIHYPRIRLAGVAGKGSPTASDLLYVKARLSYLQAF